MNPTFKYSSSYSSLFNTSACEVGRLLNPSPIDFACIPATTYVLPPDTKFDAGLRLDTPSFTSELLPGCRDANTNKLAINPGLIRAISSCVYVPGSYDIFLHPWIAHSCSYQNSSLRQYAKTRWPAAHNIQLLHGQPVNTCPLPTFDGIQSEGTNSRYSFVIVWHQDWLNHWHWHFECLPRILILTELLHSLGLRFEDIDLYVVGQSLNKVHLLTLGLLGISTSRIRFVNGPLRLRNVIHILSPLPSSYSPVIVESLRSALSVREFSPTINSYIARGPSAKNGRRITNENSLQDLLSTHGFFPATMSADRPLFQQTIFSFSQFIMAPHGSALTNMLYMKPGGLILELCHPSYMPEHDMILGKALGIRVVMTDSFSTQCDRNGDFGIDLHMIDRLVRDILA
jgi:hypothetical protein